MNHIETKAFFYQPNKNNPHEQTQIPPISTIMGEKHNNNKGNYITRANSNGNVSRLLQPTEVQCSSTANGMDLIWNIISKEMELNAFSLQFEILFIV